MSRVGLKKDVEILRSSDTKLGVMNMEAHFYEVGQLTVVEVTGRIEADQNKPFRDVCEKKLKNKKVVFCLSELNFTASANITTFFESIRMISDVKLVGLKPDFYKLLNLKGMTELKTFKTLSEAIYSTETFLD
jgi:anti-anti-sigma regulatory factor